MHQMEPEPDQPFLKTLSLLVSPLGCAALVKSNNQPFIGKRRRERGTNRDAGVTMIGMSTHLIEIVERLPNCRIVLVGDLMLDRYLYGDAERVSPEAPVPVLHYQSEEFRLGGAANVAAN